MITYVSLHTHTHIYIYIYICPFEQITLSHLLITVRILIVFLKKKARFLKIWALASVITQLDICYLLDRGFYNEIATYFVKNEKQENVHKIHDYWITLKITS